MCFCTQRDTQYTLSVFVLFMAGVCSVKIPQNNETSVWVLLLHTGYLVSQALQRLPHTGLMRDVNTGQNKGGTLLWRIKRLTINEKELEGEGNTVTSIQQPSLIQKQILPLLISLIRPDTWLTPWSRKPGRCIMHCPGWIVLAGLRDWGVLAGSVLKSESVSV